MPINQKDAKALMATGLSAVCATCTKLWDARDRGITDGSCLSVDGCGGPMSGGDFHEYKGPLVNFSGFCFVCADKPKYGIRVKNSVRVLGVCEKHSQLLYQLKVKGKTAVAVNFTGAPKEVVRKKTLGEAMAETEAEWAAEDAKKG